MKRIWIDFTIIVLAFIVVVSLGGFYGLVFTTGVIMGFIFAAKLHTLTED